MKRLRTIRWRAWTFPFLLCTRCLVACGTTSSSVPLYPADWPALQKAGNRDSTTEPLHGIYRALSEPAGPLVYSRGGSPREIFFLVPVSGARPAPELGRRNLAWHIAGLLALPDGGEPWQELERFTAALEPDAEHPDGREDRGWVKLSDGGAGVLRIECGVGDEVLATLRLAPEPERTFLEAMWTSTRGYRAEDGGLGVTAAFPLSPVERDPGGGNIAAGRFTFYRADDGSLVMLENLVGTPSGDSLAFRKWWRWPRLR